MRNRETARFRAIVVAEIRSFFDERGYLEVDTPLLAPALIPEQHIEVFATEFHDPALLADDPARQRFLIPSPEIWMKRLLGQGYGDIFQLSHCFRNHESVGPEHNPEFTMLEWYTTDASYEDAASIADALLGAVTTSDRIGDAARDAGVSETALDACAPPAERLTVAAAFERYAGLPEEVFCDERAMARSARALGLTVGEHESGEDLFHRLFLTHVEPALPSAHPLILMDYPAYVPTLAERVPDTPYARRWELYAGGRELANCYQEERDAGQLKAYLSSAARAKTEALVPHPTDLSLLDFGTAPRCSGVALGVDRLIMALTGINDIREVIF